MTTSTALTREQLETAILADVVTQFLKFKTSTARKDLLIKYRGAATVAADVIDNLVNRNWLRRKDSGAEDPQYLPPPVAFEVSGNSEFREQAKYALTVILHALQNMYVGEPSGKRFVLDDVKRHLDQLDPNQLFEDDTLKLGLYLAQDFGVLGTHSLNPARTEVISFQVFEHAFTIEDPKTEWDKVMARYKLLPKASTQNAVAAKAEEVTRQREANWEQINRLGGGGQSDVFLVRSPARVSERETCLKTIRTAIDADNRADLANAVLLYARPDTVPEVGAMKKFKIRDEGGEQQALQRLQQEIQVLQQQRPGLPKLLDSNESERWIVTEFFPRGTLEDNISQYRGKPGFALKAFLSLVNTVTQLHDEDMIHRDIKPANVFVRQDHELVLGDFGIVYLPDQPARLTRTNESVGPRDFMPPWADVGGRLENVDNRFDVYALGKLLWCMVSGRLVLQREYFNEPENDVSLMYRDDPHAHMINEILHKCVVERLKTCMGIHDMRAMVIAFVSTIEQGGQLLHDGVPRPCHVCGHGQYQPENFGEGNTAVPVNMRFWKGQDINLKKVQVFVCSSCGHAALFRTSPR